MKAIKIHAGDLDRGDTVESLLDSLRNCSTLDSQKNTVTAFYNAVKMQKQPLDSEAARAYADGLREQAMEMRADAGHLERAAEEIEKMLTDLQPDESEGWHR